MRILAALTVISVTCVCTQSTTLGALTLSDPFAWQADLVLPLLRGPSGGNSVLDGGWGVGPDGSDVIVGAGTGVTFSPLTGTKSGPEIATLPGITLSNIGIFLAIDEADGSIDLESMTVTLYNQTNAVMSATVGPYPGFQAVASTTGTGGRAFVLGGLPSDFFSNADYRLGLQARATGLSTGFEEFSLAVVPEPSAIYLLSFVAVGILTRHRVKVHASRRI